MQESLKVEYGMDTGREQLESMLVRIACFSALQIGP